MNHETKPHSCPRCGNVIENQRSVTNPRPPQPGDFTVCRQCLGVLRFGDSELERAELSEAPPKVRDALGGVIAAAKQKRGLA